MKDEAEKTIIQRLEERVSWIKSKNPHPSLKYCCPEEFVLKHGRIFEKDPNTNVKTGKERFCYRNALCLMEEDETLEYAEGYYFPGEDVTLHAWTVNKQGFVIDPTYKDQAVYFGLIIPRWYLKKIRDMRARGTTEITGYSVLEQLDLGLPLLKGEHKFLTD